MIKSLQVFRKTFSIILLFIFLFPFAASAQNQNSPVHRKLEWGKAYNDIGTFNDFSFWIGFDASFSETYIPESETYAWVIHFAPEGIYLSLQKGKALYSGVDVNAGFNFFYGLVKSPYGDRITKEYFNNMSGITFSLSSFSKSATSVGPLSNLSIGISSSTTVFKNSATDNFIRAIQYGTGFSISYALISIPLPFSVSLGIESSVEAAFYPIAAWDIWDNAGAL